MRETGKNGFQSRVVKAINERADNRFILVNVNDGNYIQGLPDITVYYENKTAWLETKGYEEAKHQPNQDTWVEILDTMTFARFIYPENEKEVLNELYEFLGI